MPAPPPVIQLMHLIASEPEGRVFLSNVLDSMDEYLVDDGFVCAYLEDLADCHGSAPGAAWWAHQEQLSLARLPAAPRRPGGYLRQAAADAAAHRDGSIWATVCSSTVFAQFHLDAETMAKDMTPLPSFPPRDADEAQRLMDSVLAREHWCLPASDTGGAWLGVPPAVGRNCWLSCVDREGDLAIDPALIPKDAGGLCEALGIVPVKVQWYLRYSFPSAAARQLLRDAPRRPTFADLGNPWFRVRSDHAAGRRHAGFGWGTTFNVGSLRTQDPAPDTGMPERVSAAIPIKNLSGLRVEVFAPRAKDLSPLKAPHAYELRLRSGCSDADLLARILVLWEEA